MFEQAKLPHAEPLEMVPNSRGSLLVGELARDRGVLPAFHARVFEAYWAKGRDIGDRDVLVELGGTVGLAEAEVSAAITDSGYLERVTAQTREAIELGAGGVPAWVIDDRVLVPGAQPHEVFERVLERLGYR